MESKTCKTFEMHKALIFSVMQKQAGTVAKALLELVMNSADAGSKRIDIAITREGFTASDEGRGFQSEKEIDEWFATFGTPHSEGDSTYGAFRMGRGQIMTFARTVWRTRTFQMNVDVRERGLDFDLIRDLEDRPGCLIEGNWYTPMKAVEFKAAVRELREMVEFAGILVTINGEVASKNPAELGWDRVTDDAYIRFEQQGGLRVYNLGVLVRSYPGHQHGACGVVVSRKQLKVNFARNEILTSECEAWGRIKEVLSGYAREKAKNTMRLDADARRHLMDQLVTGAIQPEMVKDARLIEALDGRKLKISELAGKQVIVAAADDTRADYIAQTRRDVIVVSEAFVHSCGMETKDEFQQVLRTAVAALEPKKADQIVIEDADEVLATVSKDRVALRTEDLSPQESAMLRFLEKINGDVVRMVSQRSGYKPKARRLLPGESETAEAWTNGHDWIYLERRKLNQPLTLHSALENLLILVHEYLHDASDLEGHAHDQEFLAAFHALAIYRWFGDQPISAWLESRMEREGVLPFPRSA